MSSKTYGKHNYKAYFSFVNVYYYVKFSFVFILVWNKYSWNFCKTCYNKSFKYEHIAQWLRYHYLQGGWSNAPTSRCPPERVEKRNETEENKEMKDHQELLNNLLTWSPSLVKKFKYFFLLWNLIITYQLHFQKNRR